MDVPIAHAHPPVCLSRSGLSRAHGRAALLPLPSHRSGRLHLHPTVLRAESHLNRVRDSHTEQLRNIAFYLDVAIMMLRERYAL
jgi:hypothetical protein